MTWKEQLANKLPADLAQEIDAYETQLELRKLGKIDEKLFAETRLRRGAYGQRYDNGQRHDGVKTQPLTYPRAELTKGPDTLWDARECSVSRSPWRIERRTNGGAGRSCGGVLRQHPARHDPAGFSTSLRSHRRYAGDHAATGGSRHHDPGSLRQRGPQRHGLPLAGVCHTEAFDVTPYAKALSRFLLGHPDTQDFGRKFEPAFSGCEQEACGLVTMHDLGAIAQVREGQRGFRVFVGGGLGPVPYQAKVMYEFLPEEELLPLAQAIARVFARLGEKQNRARARIKFLVAKLGIDEFRRLVEEERKILPLDPRWKTYLPQAHEFAEKPVKTATSLNGEPHPKDFDEWVSTNVYRQRQPGYAVATVTLPIGDITAWQTRQLADIARKFSGEHIRTTVEQNIVLRWVSEANLQALYRELKKVGLGEHGAGTILDVVACPGTDTCKLGIASSRGLAREIRSRLAEKFFTLDKAVQGLRIKMSGCFNSCGQHHVADIGFYGNSRTIGNRKVPHFQVLLGGKWRDNAGSYGLAIGSVPSKRVPAVVERITQRFVKERQGNESFQDFIARIGKAESRKMIEDLMEVPPYEKDPLFYSDWGDPREFTMGDMGMGECAGEVVSRLDFDLQTAERMCFEAQLKLESKDLAKADELAYKSMLQAAHGLVKELWYDAPDDPEVIAKEFRARLFEPKLFWDRFVGGKFAQDFLRRHENPPLRYDADEVHRLIEEAQLFIEASHACADKLRERKVANLKL